MSPACAGMIPTALAISQRNLREPRMRGDDPQSMTALISTILVSPACAGMIPFMPPCFDTVSREPRMRGDDPSISSVLFMIHW